MIHGPYGGTTGYVCVCVCVFSTSYKRSEASPWLCGGDGIDHPPGAEQTACGLPLCVLAKVRGMELLLGKQGSLCMHFSPSRSLVLVLVRLIRELEFIPFKFTSYSLFPR